jgi:hypothetical protein
VVKGGFSKRASSISTTAPPFRYSGPCCAMPRNFPRSHQSIWTRRVLQKAKLALAQCPIPPPSHQAHISIEESSNETVTWRASSVVCATVLRQLGQWEGPTGQAAPCTPQSSQSGPNPQPNLRFSARGYTMADGPWLYRFCCQPPRDVGTAYAEIKDEQSYLKMMDDIKKVSRDDPGSKYTVLMIHVHFHRPHLFGFLLI